MTMVNWSCGDHLTYDNYDSLWITSILRKHSWCYIFFKNPRHSPDTVRHSAKMLRNREVLLFIRRIYNWLRNSVSTDLLGDLLNALHCPTILTSNKYMQCLYEHPHTAWKVFKYEVFSSPYFPVFRLNMEIWTKDNLCFISDCRDLFNCSLKKLINN